MQREVRYFPPNTCWHSGWLIHKSYKVIPLKFTIASGKGEAPMVYLEAPARGSRSNDYSLYNTANRLQTQMQCQEANCIKSYLPVCEPCLSHWSTYDLYKPLKFSYGHFYHKITKKKKKTLAAKSCCLPCTGSPQSTRAYLDSKVNTLIGFFFLSIQKGLDSMPCRLSIHPSQRAH